MDADSESEFVYDWTEMVVAAHTGTVYPSAGHVLGDGLCHKPNVNDMIPTKWLKSSKKTGDYLNGFAALHAGQEAGGDLRGMQSARILVSARDVRKS